MLQLYNPILAWANQHLKVKFTVNDSIFGAHQPADTHQALRDFLQGMNQLCQTSGSDTELAAGALSVALRHVDQARVS